jgi:ABC-type sugar transport system permease subunit
MEEGYSLNTLMRKNRGKFEAENMGVEEFFRTLLIMLMIITFFALALVFLYLMSERKEETGK